MIRLQKMLKNYPFIHSVKVLFEGKLETKEQLYKLITPSHFITENSKENLKNQTKKQNLDINKISGKGNYKITGIHYDKISSMNVNIQVAKSGNFKFYLGFGLGIAGTGLLAYGAYKIFKG